MLLLLLSFLVLPITVPRLDPLCRGRADVDSNCGEARCNASRARAAPVPHVHGDCTFQNPDVLKIVASCNQQLSVSTTKKRQIATLFIVRCPEPISTAQTSFTLSM
jgi:hypothetical protein